MLKSAKNGMLIVIETLIKYRDGTNGYKISLISGSIACILIYVYRYRKISQLLPQKHSDDLKSLTTVSVGLCLWNLVMAGVTDSILLNLDDLLEYLKSEENLPRTLRGFFINESIHSKLNILYMRKDMKLLVSTIASLILFQAFSNVILRIVEYISFISYREGNDTEKVLQYPPVSKSVSFDDDLTTFEYLEMNLSVSTSKLNNNQSSGKNLIAKHCILFLIILINSYCIIPDIFLFNSSAIIIQYSSITVKSDHIFYAILTLFYFDVISTILKVADHPSIKSFPQFTSILSRFIWCYSSLIVAISMSSMILFSDLLINLIKLIAIYSSTPSHTFTYHVLFVTQIVINYLTHSVQMSCITNGDFSQADLMNVLSENFIWLKDALSSCCIVLNLSSFVILPLLIWIVVIESKLGRR